MAAIARSDLYDGLIRKIGYSVGLEHLVPRVKDALDEFRFGKLDGAAWRCLVQERWDRKASAEQHIADVYSQLDILRRHNSSLYPLPGLEIMAVLCIGDDPLAPGTPPDDLAVVRFLVLLKVLEADGDVFLNALAAGFDPPNLEGRLKAMLRYKRRSVAPLFRQAGSIRRLLDAISIRNQTDGTGSGGAVSRKQTYAERSRLLMAAAGQYRDLHRWTEQEVQLSRDYLEKACVTRRGWAEDFGLYERARGVTCAGEQLLARLRDRGLRIQTGADDFFAFWPYPFQLSRMNIRSNDIGAPDITAWDLASEVAVVLADASDAGERRQPPELRRDELILLLQGAFCRHQQTSRRGVIRHELPLFIAEPVLAWWIAEARRAMPDFRGFLRDELKRADRAIDFVIIHRTEGGLRLMKEGSVRAGAG
jgi:hypothetical protein